MTDVKVIFRHGEEGYHTYRIPALLTVPGGRTLAFCEGRRDSWEDYGKIDLVLKISDDGCETFSPLRAVAQNGENTAGNPCPVYDRDTGRIWLFLDTNLAEGPESLINQNKAPRGVGCMYSDDLGETWSPFWELTDELKRPGWTWYATGPCHAIQLRSGRLVIPCNHGVFDPAKGNTDLYQSHVIVSDDHGESWRLGGTVEACSNEAAVAELSDGRVYINARSMKGRPCRVTAFSEDGGDTWKNVREDPALPDPMCQASTLALPFPAGDCARPLLFSNNPYPPSEKPGANRRDLTLRMSLDDGASWTRRAQVHSGRTAYGDMAALPDGRICVLYECGQEHPYEQIALRILTIEDFKEGE